MQLESGERLNSTSRLLKWNLTFHFSEKYSSNIKIQNKYILYNKDLQYKDGIVYLPVYMTMFLRE